MSSPTKKQKVVGGKSQVLHWFREPILEEAGKNRLLTKLNLTKVQLETEYCFNIQLDNADALSKEDESKLTWLLSETFEPKQFSTSSSFLKASGAHDVIIEVGPRLSFTTAWSTNAVSICNACGILNVPRIERSRRYLIKSSTPLTKSEIDAFVAGIHDRMTENVYSTPLTSFGLSDAPKQTQIIPVSTKGAEAIKALSAQMGLAFDDWDVNFYTTLFKEKMKRDPTDVELFDMAQSNSEHSRHWFFSGIMNIDGEKKERTLFKLVKDTDPKKSGNSIIAFHDNSSAIAGFNIKRLSPVVSSDDDDHDSVGPQRFELQDQKMHGILTAETHNFPTGVAPFPGAETGTGGRIRDVQATGTGAHVVAGTSSYCVGNLQIPGYKLPWESTQFTYPDNLAKPLDIEIQASNGASDYGNKFGEPVIVGYTRSFGMRLPNGERREWIKPIMMTAGVGLLNDLHVNKGKPEKGMLVIKVGGPAYRLGMGGGAASSRVQDGNVAANLDFDAVQRGDAEMENKMNRVIRACVELGERNPIVSIHDQGAGGNGNVLKEICDPMGAELHLRRVPIGDPTMSCLELWGAEYQENNALLIRPESLKRFTAICTRENVPFGVVGEITGDGRVKVIDDLDGAEVKVPVDLPLEDVLGKMPQKEYTSFHESLKLQPFTLDKKFSSDIDACLDRVLRLLQVGSKRFLTNKVDRCVTGLVAQQQCVGPLQTPLSNVGVVSQSLFPMIGSDNRPVYTGVVTAIGEQPIKGLVNPKAMARMVVGEALTNIMWALITKIEDIKCSGNWMWAAKLPGEGAAMYDTCEALHDIMLAVGISIDGGKDSLSMAAKAGGELVKAPGQIALSAYAMSPDISKTVTPDLKPVEGSKLLFVDLSGTSLQKCRLGGSALAQVFEQIGNESPDMEDPQLVVRAFRVVQSLLQTNSLLAGHDRSDGGLIVTLLEMAFAGNCGFDVDLPQAGDSIISTLFGEELGFVLQVEGNKVDHVMQAFNKENVQIYNVGEVNALCTFSSLVTVKVNGTVVLNAKNMGSLRDIWEATSFELEMLQTNPECVIQERDGMKFRESPPISWNFDVKDTPSTLITRSPSAKPRVAILREEGSNGDREMNAAFFASGFDTWDVTVSDLRNGLITLDSFRGLVFVGGFSYADVCDSAKGWAGALRYNSKAWSQITQFYGRKDTFSLGVCNGCQLMALLGLIPGNTDEASLRSIDYSKQMRFVHNKSGRFECRYSLVKITEGNQAMMFKGMQGAVLGVWVAHGEGRAYFPDETIRESVFSKHQVSAQYVNDRVQPTLDYPFNPNGSTDAIASICSPDGRHLAMMPHPERCFRMYQLPWIPYELKKERTVSPWLRMFQNAQEWCESN